MYSAEVIEQVMTHTHKHQAVTKIQQVEQVRLMIEECGGLDKIEALQQHHREKLDSLTAFIDKFSSEVS